ncbi:MAG: DUF4349 domain-containing protein [Anaerolineaceae bacterium]|jgi:hypothetical protein|nr:DUF4349 domain-containing protein [Anaerolineaceae bacterium]
MKKKGVVLSIVLAASMLLGACAAAKSSAADEVGYYEMPASEPNYEYDMAEESLSTQGMEDSERSYTSGTGENAAASERMVIYNADMEIAVVDPVATMDTITDMAEAAGGFVVYSNVYQYTSSTGSALQRASLTVRVPAGDLESVMDAIVGLTPDPTEDVLSKNVSGQDVTSEYTDLESRLRNLEAAEAALVQLMDQAQDTEDVLDVFDELTYYRGEIETVKGRMKYLEESSALSSITVQIIAKESLQPITVAGWEPKGTAKKAIEALINAGQKLVDALIWFGIFCLPFLVPLGLAVYFLIRLIIKRRAKKLAKKDEQVEEIQKKE